MCGRFTLYASGKEVAETFALPEVPEIEPRYNIAPTQPVLAVRLGEHGREAARLRWGLIPSWAKDEKVGHSLINARCETVATKASFRTAFQKRRCLIPANGFYEWMATGKKHKQPYFISREDGGLLAFAGLWDRWHGPEGIVESCSIVTTNANPLVRPIHDRMPVILPRSAWEAWLEPGTPKEELTSLLAPYPETEMSTTAVGKFVSNPRNEGPQCLAS